MSEAGRTVIVTGAGGFVGRRLVQSLIANPVFAGDRIVACDLSLPDGVWPDRVRCVSGDIGDPAVRDAVLAGGAEVVFHLAGVLGGAAEVDPKLARRVNIDATLALMEALRGLPNSARLVFASSIAVFGPGDRALIDDASVPDPVLLYGAQKRMIEVAIEQASARGWIDGVALRLPGIVARPGSGQGLKSAFLSDLFHARAEGRDIVLPVSPQGTTWLVSLSACVDALVHAAQIAPGALGRVRAMTLPAQRVTFADLVVTLQAVLPASLSTATFAPDPEIDAQFGRQPALTTTLADGLGFRHDGDVETLVRRALADRTG